MAIFTRTRLALTLGLGLGLGGCGLISGLDNLGVSGDATVDAGPEVITDDSSIDVGPGCDAGACSAPLGFQPIYFALDRSTACKGSQDVIVDPGTPPPGACACTCSATESCTPASIQWTPGGSNCTGLSQLLGVLDGGCNAENTSSSPMVAIPPFPLVDASCTSTLVTGGSLPSTQGRVCSLEQCGDCTPPQGFALCYIATGKQACPTGTSHLIASNATIACSACSACKATGECRGSVSFFGNSICDNLKGTIDVNGACVSFSFGGISGVQYNPVIADAGCTAGSSSASVVLTAESTVCCP